MFGIKGKNLVTGIRWDWLENDLWYHTPRIRIHSSIIHQLRWGCLAKKSYTQDPYESTTPDICCQKLHRQSLGKLHQYSFEDYRVGLDLHKWDKFCKMPPARNNPQRRNTGFKPKSNGEYMVNIFRIQVGGRKHPTHNIYQDEMRSVGLRWRTANHHTDPIDSLRSCFIRESVSPGVLASFLTNLKQMRMNCTACFNTPPLYGHILNCLPASLPPLWALHPSHLGSHGRMPTKPNGKGHEGKRDAQAIPKPRL